MAVQVFQEFNLILNSINRGKIGLIQEEKENRVSFTGAGKRLLKKLKDKGYGVSVSKREFFGVPIMTLIVMTEKESTHKISFEEIKIVFGRILKETGLPGSLFQPGDCYWI